MLKATDMENPFGEARCPIFPSVQTKLALKDSIQGSERRGRACSSPMRLTGAEQNSTSKAGVSNLVNFKTRWLGNFGSGPQFLQLPRLDILSLKPQPIMTGVLC